MSLNSTNTGNDICSAIESDLGLTLDAATRTLWSAIIAALYTRIKADIVIASTVASAIPVSTTGTATAQSGTTTSTGTALNNSVT